MPAAVRPGADRPRGMVGRAMVGRAMVGRASGRNGGAVTAERSDAKFSLLNGGVGNAGFLQIGVSSYDEGSTAKLMAIGNVKPMQSDMEAGNVLDRAPLGSQPPIFVCRRDANRVRGGPL